MSASTELVGILAGRYQIGRDYVAAYLDYWHTNPALTSCYSLQDVDNLRDHEKMWLDFALSANWRGRIFADHICNALHGKVPASVLDIGCGFGGMLAAFCERGAQVTGIEIDPVRIGLATANLKAFPNRSTLTEDNVLDRHWVAEAGRFDVVTCIDVIEHVADVAQTLKNIDALLAPGGTAFLEIPNKDCLSFVLADGHFSLFGITQLPRWAAVRYHAHHFGFEYDVGDYYDSSYYTRIATSLNLSAQLTLSPLHGLVAGEKIQQLEQSIDAVVGDFGSRQFCDAEVDSLLLAAVQRFMRQYRSAKANPAADHDLQYLAPFWLLRLTKP